MSAVLRGQGLRSATAVALALLAVGVVFICLRSEETGAARSSQETPGAWREAWPEPEVSSEAEGAKRQAVESPPAPEAARAEGGWRVRIVSAEGLEITRVEVRDQAGAGAWYPVNQGVADLPAGDPEPLIHAPGHVPKRVRAGEDPILLEGDDVLALRCPGLQDLTTGVQLLSWVPNSEERFRDVCAFGFADEHCWVLASEAQRIREDWPWSFIVDLKLKDRSTVHVDRALAPGQHTEYWLPLGDTLGRGRTADLELTISGPEEALAGPLRLDLCSILPQDQRLLVDEQLDWGRLQVYAPQVAEERSLEAGTRSARFESVPLGREHVLSCLCEQTGGNARVVFTHDGSPVTLVLRQGIHVVGSLAVPGGARPPEQVRVKWWFSGSGPFAKRDDPWAWRGWLDLSVDAGGAFSLVLPREIPRSPAASYPPPPLGSLILRADACRPLTREFQVPPDGGTADLGVLALAPLAPAFVLAPGHGLDARAVGDRRVWVDDGSIVGYRVERAVETGDGSLHLFPAVDTASESEVVLVSAVRLPPGESCLLAWPEGGARALLLGAPDTSRAFRLGADGRFVRAPEQDYDVTLTPAPGSTEVRWVEVWWQWNSMPASSHLLAIPPDRAAVERFRAPVSGVDFCWVSTGQASAGSELLPVHVTPLAASTAVVPLDAP